MAPVDAARTAKPAIPMMEKSLDFTENTSQKDVVGRLFDCTENEQDCHVTCAPSSTVRCDSSASPKTPRKKGAVGGRWTTWCRITADPVDPAITTWTTFGKLTVFTKHLQGLEAGSCGVCKFGPVDAR